MGTATRAPPARASTLRTLSLVLAFTAAAGLIFGTAGFTAIEADRGVEVSVVDDDDAYLGYNNTITQATGDNTTTVTARVEYRNRFAGDLTLDITADAGGEITHETVEISSGETESITVTRTCPGDSISFSFVATGDGSGVSVSLERSHTVTCSS